MNKQTWYVKIGMSGKYKYKATLEKSYTLLPGMNCQGKIRSRSGNCLLAEVSNNTLTVYQGFTWDGLTRFPDLKCAMEASLVHDALYQIVKKHCANRESKLIECADQHYFYCMVKTNGFPCSWLASSMYEAIRAYQRTESLWKGFLYGLLGISTKQKFTCSPII